jgi:hypothetical protein
MVRVFYLAWLLFVVAVLGLSPYLPEEVGDPGKTMSREAFMWFILGMGVFIPWQCTQGVRWIALRWPDAINLPNKDYWWAPERRQASLAWMVGHMHTLGIQVLVLFAALYYTELQSAQPHWPQVNALGGSIGASLLAAWFGWWIWKNYQRFPAPPANTPHRQSSPSARTPRRD